MKTQTKSKLKLHTVNSRTQKRLETIKKDLRFYNIILQEKFSDEKPQIEAFINKWLVGKPFTAKLTREDSSWGRLNLAFEFPARLGKNKNLPYKIQGKWDNDYSHWIWIMSDLEMRPLVNLSEDAQYLAHKILFTSLLHKFLCLQILENEAKAVVID